MDIESKCSVCMNRNPLLLTPNDLFVEVKHRAEQKGIHFFPVCDSEKRLRDIARQDAMVKRTLIDIPFVIMAGGFGKRMGALTASTPKPLLQIKGKPILTHIIERASKFGFFDFVITSHFESDQIKTMYGDGSELGISISYIEEQKPLGTAGSLYFLPKFSGPFIVMNGDVIAEVDFFRFVDNHIRLRAAASLSVYTHEIVNPFGVVEIQDSVVEGFCEKPTWSSKVNAGIYVIDRSVVSPSILNGESCDMNVFLNSLLNTNHRIGAFDLTHWADVGDPDTYFLYQ